MEQRIYTVPIIHSMGSNSAAGGCAGVKLETRDRANASIMAPKTGTVSVGIVVSSNQPRQGIQIFRGYSKGAGNFQEAWLPPSGLTNINIGTGDTGHRIHVLSNISVQEGEYLGIRITNREEGYNFNLSSIFIEYS